MNLYDNAGMFSCVMRNHYIPSMVVEKCRSPPPYVLIFEMEFRPFFRVLFYQNLEKQIDAQNYAPNDIPK